MLPKNTKWPQLGLVCITWSDLIRYRTITLTRYLALPESQRAHALFELYRENIERLQAAIAYCLHEGILLYRLPSFLFPHADFGDGVGANVLGDLAPSLSTIGMQAKDAGMRLLLHPDQFVVLSSDSPETVANSITILKAQARILDLLEQEQSPWAPIILHGGKGGRAAQLLETIRVLPENIRTRLTLENDERAYSAAEICAICHAAKIPMVFDAHHHICYEKLTSYNDPSVATASLAARETWTPQDWQLVHISNGEGSFQDRRHSELIENWPNIFDTVRWVEVEAKKKEEAIFALRQKLGL